MELTISELMKLATLLKKETLATRTDDESFVGLLSLARKVNAELKSNSKAIKKGIK